MTGINVCAYPHDEVRRAIEVGILTRPDRCSECNRIRKVVAHHDDYAKPEAVRWLCYTCHAAWHRANGPGANKHLKKNYPREDTKPRKGRCDKGRPRTAPHASSDPRFEAMVSMRKEGCTLEQIGQHYGITRERVRQIIGTLCKPKPLHETAFDRCMEVLARWNEGVTRTEIQREFGLTDRQLRLYDLPARPKATKPIAHGTAYGYQRGCRCGECTGASTKRHATWVQRKRADGFAGLKHGVRSTYCAGCRCRECVYVGRSYQRKQEGYADRKETAKKAWKTRRARYGSTGKAITDIELVDGLIEKDRSEQ